MEILKSNQKISKVIFCTFCSLLQFQQKSRYGLRRFCVCRPVCILGLVSCEGVSELLQKNSLILIQDKRIFTTTCGIFQLSGTVANFPADHILFLQQDNKIFHSNTWTDEIIDGMEPFPNQPSQSPNPPTLHFTMKASSRHTCIFTCQLVVSAPPS